MHPHDSVVTTDPVVGTYLDEVYLGRMVGANLNTLDVERVEILRGPQGTLFGRNTIGGAVNVVTRKPTDARQARVRLTLGNFGRADVEGVLNMPWDEGRQALRLSAALRDRAGFAHTTAGEELDDERLRFLRMQYRWSPDPDWILNLSVDASDTRSGAVRRTLLSVLPSAESIPAGFGNPEDTLLAYVDPHAHELPLNSTGPVRTRVWGAAAVLTAQIARLEWKSISSWRRLDSSGLNADHDATPYDLSLNRYRYDRQHQLSQEFQARGVALDDQLRWTAGLYYFREGGGFFQRVRTFIPGNFTWNENLPAGQARNMAAALYAQGEYAIGPHLKLTAGARFNHEDRQLTSFNSAILNGNPICRLSVQVRDDPALCRATLPERGFNYTPWSASLGYQSGTDSLYYLKVSRGHHAGGYNIRGAGVLDLTTFEPERVTTGELGAHMDWVEQRLRVNVALFHSWFDAIQVTVREPTPPGVPGTAVIRNGGAAHIAGGELEATARLGGALLSLAMGITHGKFTRLNPHVEEITLDSHFPLTPRHSANLGIDLPVRLGSAHLDLHADYAWRDEVWHEYAPDTLARQGSFGLLNVSIATSFSSRALRLSVWVRNVADEKHLTRVYEGTFFNSAIPGDPRTFGMTLDYKVDRGND
jgi:iron complex outermembrane receptor protein